MSLSTFPHAEMVMVKGHGHSEMGNAVLPKRLLGLRISRIPWKSDLDLWPRDHGPLWPWTTVNPLLCKRHISAILSPTSSLRVIAPLFLTNLKDVELHSYTLLQHCAKDQTQTQIFNKDIKFTAFESPMSFCDLQCRKKFLHPITKTNKIERWEKHTSKPIFSVSPTWKTDFKMSNKKS